MTIQWQPAPTGYGTFKDTLFEFFKLLEAPIQQDRLNLHVVNGNLTIGIGFDLKAGGEKVARTIADLEGQEAIAPPPLSEAIQYRTLDRGIL